MELEPGFKLSEAGPIPDDWEVTTIGQVAARRRNAIVGGPFGSDLTSQHYQTSGVPVIRGSNMHGRYVHGPFVYVSAAKAKALEANLAEAGDLVFTQRGTLGQVALVPSDGCAAYLISQSQMKVSLDDQLCDAKFLIQVCEQPEFQRKFISSAIQTGVPHFNLAILRAVVIPRPPVREQRGIASTLKEIDTWIASAEAEAAKLASVKAAAMDALLTPTIRLPGFSGQWVRQSLRQLGTTLGGLTGKAAGDFGQGDDRYVSFNSVMADIFLREADLQPVRIGPKERQTRVQTGDLVFTGSSETPDEVGTCSLVPDGFPSAAVNSFCFVLRARTSSSFHPFFLAAVMRFGEGRSLLQGIGQGGIRYNLSKPSFLELQVSVPPTLAEQQAIAAVLSDIDAALAAARAVVAKARSVKAAAMDALLSGRVRLPGFGPAARRAPAKALEAA